MKSVRRHVTARKYDTDKVLPSFEEALPLACNKFACPFSVFVKRIYQQDEFYKNLKVKERETVRHKKITLSVPISQTSLEERPLGLGGAKPTGSQNLYFDEDSIVVSSVYDNAQNLVELIITNVRGLLPLSLIQILVYLAPAYKHLRKITMSRCTINSLIIYELSKVVNIGHFTDICLDWSPLKEACYYILLDCKSTSVKNFSLCGCKINDEVCKEIAARLHFMCPAEKTLLLLNLSCNLITDEGAKYLGEALKTNRRLRFLNLANNRIGDQGADYILSSLTKFRLTCDENLARRARRLSYLRRKSVLVIYYLNECCVKSNPPEEAAPSQTNRKISRKTKSSATLIKRNSFKKDPKKDRKKSLEDCVKAETYATEILGPFVDPYHPRCLSMMDNNNYCNGNLVLCYLNLSYNHLGYLSVKKLVSVLQTQRYVKMPGQTGLVRVVIEGNPMPTTCIEYQNIGELTRMGKNMQQFGGRLSDPNFRKRRSTRMSIVSSASGKTK